MNGFPVGLTTPAAATGEGTDLAGALPLAEGSEGASKDGVAGRAGENASETGAVTREFGQVLASALDPEVGEIEGDFVDVVPMEEDAAPSEAERGELRLLGSGRPETADAPVKAATAEPMLVHSEPATGAGGERPYEFEFEIEAPDGSLPLEATVVDETVATTEGERPLLFATSSGKTGSGAVVDAEWSGVEPLLKGSEPLTDLRRAELSTPRLEPDLSQLDPELRARLEQVVERMRAEFGHNVKVVEAYRTPERQQALFAQGRTTPGPVVTWTENSLHTEGLAVDVIVDGSFSSHEGYRRLADVAAQEGLRTLWPKDPGHLQLDSRLMQASNQEALPESRMAEGPMIERAAVAARVASVETPMARAAVASVAEVAVPGSAPTPVPTTDATGPELVASSRTAEAATAAAQLAENVSTESAGVERVIAAETTAERLARAGTTESTPRVETIRSPLEPVEEANPAERLAERRMERAAYARIPETTPLESGAQTAATLEASRRGGAAQEAALAAAGVTESGLPTAGSLLVQSPRVTSPESLHRISQIRELQELAYPRQLGQMTLRMMDGLGEEGRMRVRLQGGGVATSIGVRDLGQADLLRSRIGTLEQSLRGQGIEPLSVRVAALTSALDAMDTSAWNASDNGSDAELANNQQKEAQDERERREGRRSGESRNETPYQDARENHR